MDFSPAFGGPFVFGLFFPVCCTHGAMKDIMETNRLLDSYSPLDLSSID